MCIWFNVNGLWRNGRTGKREIGVQSKVKRTWIVVHISSDWTTAVLNKNTNRWHSKCACARALYQYHVWEHCEHWTHKSMLCACVCAEKLDLHANDSDSCFFNCLPYRMLLSTYIVYYITVLVWFLDTEFRNEWKFCCCCCCFSCETIAVSFSFSFSFLLLLLFTYLIYSYRWIISDGFALIDSVTSAKLWRKQNTKTKIPCSMDIAHKHVARMGSRVSSSERKRMHINYIYCYDYTYTGRLRPTITTTTATTKKKLSPYSDKII